MSTSWIPEISFYLESAGTSERYAMPPSPQEIRPKLRLMEEIRRSPPGMVLKPCKSWNKLPFPQPVSRISEPSTILKGKFQPASINHPLLKALISFFCLGGGGSQECWAQPPKTLGIPDSKTLPIEVHRDSMDEECSHTSSTATVVLGCHVGS